MRKSGTNDVNQDENDRKPAAGPVPPAASSAGNKEDWIGRQLRRVFDDALSEPLPDDIMSLLERIDEDSGNTDKPQGGGA
jgi:hypothetical protein